jgi:simple sugar transport system ATP-binding protein
MVGRSVRLTAPVPPAPVLGAPALVVERLTLARRGHRPVLEGLSLSVRGGEIVGVAGIEGNGQSELLGVLANPRAVFQRHAFGGRSLHATGRLEILGSDARSLAARAARALGFGLVPEDRHHQGLILAFDLVRNFVLGLHRDPAFCRRGVMRWGAATKRFAAAATAFDIRPRRPTALAKSLSGGNQQKIVVARELARDPRLLVCAQPTRGVDVGSIEFIHGKIIEARNAGTGVLLVSSSLEEILALSDRILVIYEGRITGEFRRGTASEPELGRYLGGAHA